DYVHRIGRTGRAGRSGTAITVVAPAEQKSVTAIEKLIGQSIPWMTAPPRAAQEERAQPGERAHHRPHRHKPAHKPAHKASPARSEAPRASAGAAASEGRVTHLDEVRAR